ncbi:hypothetical protein LTR78_003161 [Recurvomyces mirabilis]|uniref:Domain of unknown function at the cortex 1 domain-containing protein n=1 Tax=Recurvomyces mirabilis TaxID=574656 RepID=A0AAE1C3U5_9PEZI|nr:hypothetical protein LTR78_003161 [Recurvomyces mirabilis]KAK5157019.1 hypothetical protein LTS14_004536 [Recurvomyces mirabilis]
MASIVKQKLHGLTSGSGNDAEAAQEAEKYKLLVTAGPSYNQDQHQVVRVNTNEAIYVENEFVRAKIKVNIRGYHGLPSGTPAISTYFDDPVHEKDQYSVAFSFVPKQNLPSVDTVWGNDFDHPIKNKLPPGFNTAFKIVKEFIDPGLECDAYADEPWLYGPSLSCWFAFRVGDQVGQQADFPEPGVVKEGGDGEGQEIRHKIGLPETGDKRRKHFLSAPHREAFTFEKGRVYQGDFYNPYLDFPNFSLKLPGFSLKVVKYIDQKSHCLRYVFKNRKTQDVYFTVHIHLLWGEQLQQAVQREEEQRQLSSQGVVTQPLNALVGGSKQVPVVENGRMAKGHEGSQSSVRNGDHSSSAPAPAQPKKAPPPETQIRESTNDQSVSSHTAPQNMQLHPGNQAAAADFGTTHSRTAPDMAGLQTATENVRLHPGDQSASAAASSVPTASASASTQASTDVAAESVISRMLQSTSSSDQTGKKLNYFNGDNVD